MVYCLNETHPQGFKIDNFWGIRDKNDTIELVPTLSHKRLLLSGTQSPV